MNPMQLYIKFCPILCIDFHKHGYLLQYGWMMYSALEMKADWNLAVMFEVGTVLTMKMLPLSASIPPQIVS